MTRRKASTIGTRFRLWLRTFIPSGTTQQKHNRVRHIRPTVEALEDRILLSSSPGNPLPILSLASPPSVPSVAAVSSYMTSMMNQWSDFVTTVQQDVIGVWKAIGREIAQEVISVEQKWDQLLGININGQNLSPNTALQQGVGSGSGSGSSSGHDTPLTTEPPVHSPPIVAEPMGGGSGGGSGSGSGSGSGGGGSPTIYLDSASYTVNENALRFSSKSMSPALPPE